MMDIYSGRKGTAKHLGNVAEYCANCKSINIFRLIQRGEVGHIYGITTNNPVKTDRVINCSICNCYITVGPHDFKFFSDFEDIEELIDGTNPKLREQEFYEDGFMNLSDEQKRFNEITKSIADACDEFKKDVFRQISVVGALLLGIFIICSILVALVYLDMINDSFLAAMVIGMPALIAFFIYQEELQSDRAINRIIKKLAPIQPKEDELRYSFEFLVDARRAFIKKLKIKKLLKKFRERGVLY